MIDYNDFSKVDLRSGRVTNVEEFVRARKPAYKVWVDFGPEVGVLQTSAQITTNYSPHDLVGKLVIGCINLGERNIAGFISQFLLVGFSDADGAIRLATIDGDVPNGEKLH